MTVHVCEQNEKVPKLIFKKKIDCWTNILILNDSSEKATRLQIINSVEIFT